MSGVGRCQPKNGYRKDSCLEKIGLCTQSWVSILSPTSNMIWEKQHHEGYITTSTQHSSWQSQLGMH